jgi:prepilin-type N-terminal cleavage/methylation domain-containing protein
MRPVRKVIAGFTLIELLIVVAIIAILALIAVPNFLEAQMRAKIARVRTDFRLLNVAIEAYWVDNNTYPPDNGGALTGSSWWNDYLPMVRLTTPIAYITSVPTNPFFDLRASRIAGTNPQGRGNYAYWGGDRHPLLLDAGAHIFWHIVSCGPDMVSSLDEGNMHPSYILNRDRRFIDELYDPTNGTVSRGDLHLCARGMSN